jgi:hypothetical protein
MFPMSERHVPHAVDQLVTELQGVFGTRLRCVATYGEAVHLGGHDSGDSRQIHTLVVVDALPAPELRACAGLAAAWRRRGLAAPLLLTAADLQRSLDAFPIEFDQIVADHAMAWGDDPFALLRVDSADLRRACETQARSHALHLRESYVECAAEPKSLARLVSASAAPFRALVAGVARLHGERGPLDAAGFARVAARAGLDAAVVSQVLAAAGSPITAADAESMFPVYLEAAEQLVRHVDTWRP